MTDSDQKQLGEVFQQSRSNSEEIKNLRSDFNVFAQAIRDSIDHLGDRINRSSRTDWQALGIWVGVVFAILTPVLYFQHEQVIALELRLDRRVDRLERIDDERVKAEQEELRAIKSKALKIAQ